MSRKGGPRRKKERKKKVVFVMYVPSSCLYIDDYQVFPNRSSRTPMSLRESGKKVKFF